MHQFKLLMRYRRFEVVIPNVSCMHIRAPNSTNSILSLNETKARI